MGRRNIEFEMGNNKKYVLENFHKQNNKNRQCHNRPSKKKSHCKCEGETRNSRFFCNKKSVNLKF